ncbi:MAG: ABC transporter permease [Micromonosporaceae bacterium]|nr:ABC transporter permease [Micromonosporaceae bacterium]
MTPYRHLLRGQVRAQTAYRASFVVNLVSNVWATVADVLTVLVLFRVTTSLAGFSLAEALVMVGLSACGFALADLAAGNIERLRHYVRTGLLDALLVRPLRALPQLLLMDIGLQRLSRVGVGAAVLVAALVAAPVEWTPARLALAVLAPLAGALFFSAIFVAGATVAFWWVESGELANSLTYGGKDLTAYPMTIYGPAFRRVFGFGLGFAFVGYYPALALLGRPDPLGLPGWVGWVSPAVAAPAVGAAALLWRVGIRHYRSTGS